MKLEKVKTTQTKVETTCTHCKRNFNIKDMYANVEGIPYVDYICSTCALRLEL